MLAEVAAIKILTGGLLGAVLGFAGSFAWKTRPLTMAMSRGASRRIIGLSSPVATTVTERARL